MLDIKYILENQEQVESKLSSMGEKIDFSKIENLSNERKILIQRIEEINSIRKNTSKEIGDSKGKPSESLIRQMKSFGLELSKKSEKLKDIENNLENILLSIPNLPLDSTLIGENDKSNKVLKTFNEKNKIDSSIPHWDLGEKFKIIDLEKGVKLTGARWYLLAGKGAMLQRALVQWMLNEHVFTNGYKEIAPPYLVNKNTMTGSGNLPKFEETLFSDSCLLYTSPSPRDRTRSRMPSSA